MNGVASERNTDSVGREHINTHTHTYTHTHTVTHIEAVRQVGRYLLLR